MWDLVYLRAMISFHSSFIVLSLVFLTLAFTCAYLDRWGQVVASCAFSLILAGFALSYCPPSIEISPIDSIGDLSQVIANACIGLFGLVMIGIFVGWWFENRKH